MLVGRGLTLSCPRRYFCLQMFSSGGDLQHAAGGDAQPQHQCGGGSSAGAPPAGSTHSCRYTLVRCCACGSDADLNPLCASALGYSVPTVPNGVSRIPSVGEAPSHPSTRHPSVASTRLPSVGEESTHPLLVAEEAVRCPLPVADARFYDWF